MFEVSPDTSGFLMRPSGAAVQAPVSCLPLQLGSESDCAPVLGKPVAFTLSGPIPGSDAPPMTFPVYPSRPERWSSDILRTYDVSGRDAYCSPMDTGDSPLVDTGLPGCPYQITSYTGSAVADTNPAYGMQLHHPRFLEFIGAPESARLLYRSPTFWIQLMGEEDAVVAAINLQRDAGVILSNLQILSQFVTSLQRMSTEMLDLGMGHVVFPSQEVAALSPAPLAPLAPRAAQCGRYGIITSSNKSERFRGCAYNACMNCRYCFPEGSFPSGK